MNAMTPAERFAVALTPDPTVARIARQRSTLRLQVIFALAFVAVLLLVWLGPQMLPEDARRVVQGALPSWSIPALVVIWAVPTLARIILTMAFLKRAKQDLASLGKGWRSTLTVLAWSLFIRNGCVLVGLRSRP